MTQSQTKEATLRAFLDEAKEAVPDWLAVGSEAAWRACHPKGEAPRWLDACWLAAQRGEAALRIIKMATRLGMALESEAERASCRLRLLGLEGVGEGADEPLLAYLHPLRPGQWKQVLVEMTAILPQTNVKGYRAIAEEAARLGWPTHYREDLTGIDLGILCSPGAPSTFWWGVRAAGTDLFRPNDLSAVRWAKAQPGAGAERRFYAYTGEALLALSLEEMIVQLVRSLDPASFGRALRAAEEAEELAERAQPGRYGSLNESIQAYQQARRATQRARDELAEVEALKLSYV